MDNYRKGKCVEEPLERDRIPIPNMPEDFLWMQVHGGSKLPNLLRHALGIIADGGNSVLWTGSGGGVLRAISCAEVMKRHTKMLHQITKIGYRKTEEFWEPEIDGLERLVVSKEVPIIHILLSTESLDSNEAGYQSLENKNPFWNSQDVSRTPGNRNDNRRKKKPKISSQEIASMGLQSEQTKGKGHKGNLKNKKPDASKEK